VEDPHESSGVMTSWILAFVVLALIAVVFVAALVVKEFFVSL
jgi:hypothetical protein